jgi:hypothetical protein
MNRFHRLVCTLGAALSLIAILGAETPACGQTVRAFNQRRSTYASAEGSSRTNSVDGFGNFSSDLHVSNGSPINAYASQFSGIIGDSTVADSDVQAESNAAGVAEGRSDFLVYFLVQARTGFTLVGRVESSATGAPQGNTASASLRFSGPGTLATSGSTCTPGADLASSCANSKDLTASGLLEPGVYALEAHASAAGDGSGGAANTTARYRIMIRFDGPIVDVGTTTWTRIKTLYR